MKYFVVLNRYGTPMPLVDRNDDPKLFDTKKEALHAGNNNALGTAAGYEVYEWPFESDV